VPTTSARLLALLSLLQARRDWPAGVLADRLGVSDRTVRRDVDRLRELGYPVASTRGREGGYRLDAGAELPPLLFDDEQAVALAVALRTAAASGAGVGEAAARSLRTVRDLMPARLRPRVDAVLVEVADPPGADGPADPALLVALSAATRAHETVRFDYATPGRPAAAGPSRSAEPHHLVTRAGRWYLVAWDPDRADWRTFRADRMRLRTPGGPRFAPRELPGGDVAAFLTARFRGATDPDADWPCRGEAVVHAPAHQVAPWVRDGVVEELGTDRCRLVLGSWSWPGLAAALARFDADLDVVGPPELAEACRRLAGRLSRAADGSTADGRTAAGPGDGAHARPDGTSDTSASRRSR
jgi:predicted DNA-binding transcriptional regulator YafY